MAIKKSAQKALRQSLRRKKRNLAYKKRIKEISKKIRLLLSQNKKGEAQSLLPQLYQALDKAAKKGVIKKNTASRKKARMVKLINKSGSQNSKTL